MGHQSLKSTIYESMTMVFGLVERVYELGVKNDFFKFPMTSPHTKVQQTRPCDKHMFQIRTCVVPI